LNIKRFGRTNIILSSIVIFLILWIIGLSLFVSYVVKSTDKNWDSIQSEKISKEKNIGEKAFKNYQNSLKEVNENIVNNLNFRSYIENRNFQKVFEFSIRSISQNDVVCEIYDKNLSPISFYGRQLESDNLSLSRAMYSGKFSVIKDIGFYTYLIIYSPIKSVNDDNKIIGVCSIGKLMDVKSQMINKFYPDFGITNDIYNSTGSNIILYSSESISGVSLENQLWKEKIFIDLIGIDNSIIGRIQFPDFDRQLYIQGMKLDLDKYISILVFFASLFLILLFFNITKNIKDEKYSPIKIILFGLILLGIRYIWIAFKFPSIWVTSDIFSGQNYYPRYFSSLIKSLGELLVTAIFVLFFLIYIAKIYSHKEFRLQSNLKDTGKSKVFSGIFSLLILFLLFSVLFKLFGDIIQSLIYDSNIKFFDKTNFLPAPDLLIFELIILILSFSFFFISCSLSLIVINRLEDSLFPKISAKYRLAGIYVLFLILNYISGIFIPYVISPLHRFIILTMIFLFIAYINKYLTTTITMDLFSLRNFAIVILMSILITPSLILENLNSQQKLNVENLGKSITGEQGERAVFLLSNELLNLNNNHNLESIISDKGKINKSAFLIWKDSKLSSENFNSAVIIMDSTKKILSDFNIMPNELESDSIVNYVAKKFINKIIRYNNTGSTKDTNDVIIDSVDSNLEYFPVAFDNINIFKNLSDKYYVGISVIEKKQFKNTRYPGILGYLIIVLKADVKNVLSGSNQSFFKSNTNENYLNKIISYPVISEFFNDKIESSSDMDVARELVYTTPYIKEKLNSTSNARIWEFGRINETDYNTLFLRAEYKKGESGGNNIQRLIAISVKDNEIGLNIFYYMKIVIYLLVAYFIIYLLIISFFSLRVKTIRLSFRNKLFITFLLVSIIPVSILGVYNRTYLIKKNDLMMQNQINSDLNFVTDIMKSEKQAKQFVPLSINADSTARYYSNILKKYFRKTDKNINIYTNGKLSASTNEELYKSDLLDTRIDADGYYNLYFLKNAQYIKTQSIGKFSFLEGFKPLFDSNGKISAIVSSLSVYKEKEISEELTETTTFIFGSYVLIILTMILLVSYFTGKLSKPILLLKEATDKLSAGEENVSLEINRSDEIGALVESFNKMTKELKHSRENLKRAEREAAWRDIARRVAHEIKNPLTPMKLSIQYLEKVYKDKSNDETFEKILRKTIELISNEIDKLNHIATEFSNFAKLPKNNNINLQLNQIIEEVLSLYAHYQGITFEKDLAENLPEIMADKQELNRVFQNLIKNAIQSIEDSGVVKVKTYLQDSSVIVEITDTGCGMEKEVLSNLFEPNFSTKSMGMGLGLAITKKTLDNMQASIEFKSEVGKGTNVTIKFKIN